MILPRQARDKHRESTQKRTRFCRGSRGDAAASEGLLCVCSAGCGGCAADLWLLRGLLRVREAAAEAAEAAEEGAYRQWRGDGGD